jgi:hypothetical protein
MIKKIILHLGLHKTATSSIQEALFHQQNRDKILRSSILYPISFGGNHGQTFYSMFCDKPEIFFSNIIAGLTKSQIDEKNLGFKNQLIEEINNCDQENLLISGEAFSLLPTKNLADLKDFLIEITHPNVDFEVIIFVRNPVNLIISDLQQGIKMEFNTYEHELKYRYSIIKDLFQKRLSPTFDVFKASEVKICAFETAVKHQFGPVGYFLETIGFDEKTISEFLIDKYNESICSEAVDVLSFINKQLPLYRNGKIGKGRSYSDTRKLKNIGRNKFDVPLDEKMTLYQNAQDDIAWLHHNTGIDYRNLKFTDNYKETIIDIKLINQYKSIFHELSFELQTLIIRYLGMKLDLDSSIHDNDVDTAFAEISNIFDAQAYKNKMGSVLKNELDIPQCHSTDYVLSTINNFLIDLSKVDYHENISKCFVKNNSRNCFTEFVIKIDKIDAQYSKPHNIENANQLAANKRRNKVLQLIYEEKGKGILLAIKNVSLYLKLKNVGLEGFDADYYKLKYPYITEKRVTPLFHFIMRGVYLGYMPNKSFNTKQYIKNNPKIVVTGQNALAHYNQSIRHDNKSISKIHTDI